MTHLEWFILLYAIGIVLVIAELFLPTHGILGVGGLGFVLAGILYCFLARPWLGIGMLAATMTASPFVWVLTMKIFPRTPMGRNLVLPPIHNPVPPSPVQMGQLGITISELRPMGICEFSGQRVETLSEQGIIPAGRKVQVVNLANRRPTVRTISA
jgi:membrane-bound ClpP family serine protease